MLRRPTPICSADPPLSAPQTHPYQMGGILDELVNHSRAAPCLARFIAMLLKGVLVVPPARVAARNGETPATQRIANRPLICHAIESLTAAGAGELAVVAGHPQLDEIRECIEATDSPAVAVSYLASRGRGDLLDALGTAAPFVGEQPAVAHYGDGLLGQPLRPLTELLGRTPADLTLLIHQCAEARDRLGPGIQKLLGVSQLAGSRTQLALTGVCVFGPGGVRQASRGTRPAENDVQLIDVADDLASRGLVVDASLVHSWRRYAGDPRDLLELNRIVLDQQAAPAEPVRSRATTGSRGASSIHPTAQVDLERPRRAVDHRRRRANLELLHRPVHVDRRRGRDRGRRDRPLDRRRRSADHAHRRAHRGQHDRPVGATCSGTSGFHARCACTSARACDVSLNCAEGARTTRSLARLNGGRSPIVARSQRRSARRGSPGGPDGAGRESRIRSDPSEPRSRPG